MHFSLCSRSDFSSVLFYFYPIHAPWWYSSVCEGRNRCKIKVESKDGAVLDWRLMQSSSRPEILRFSSALSLRALVPAGARCYHTIVAGLLFLYSRYLHIPELTLFQSMAIYYGSLMIRAVYYSDLYMTLCQGWALRVQIWWLMWPLIPLQFQFSA